MLRHRMWLAAMAAITMRNISINISAAAAAGESGSGAASGEKSIRK